MSIRPIHPLLGTLPATLLPLLILFLPAFVLDASATLAPNCDDSSLSLDSGSVAAPIEQLWGAVEPDDSEVEWEYVQGVIGSIPYISINPVNVTFSGPCVGLDATGPAVLFDLLAIESVRHAVATNILPVDTTCQSPTTISVWIPNCVVVAGSGATTTYSSVSPCEQTKRTVEFCRIGSGPLSVGIVSNSHYQPCPTGLPTCTPSGQIQ